MDHPPRPHLDANSLTVLHQAIQTLAILRGCWTPTGSIDDIDIDPAHVLHLLASLTRQAHNHLPTAIQHAREHGYAWTHIHMLLDTHAATLRHPTTPPQRHRT